MALRCFFRKLLIELVFWDRFFYFFEQKLYPQIVQSELLTQSEKQS